MSNINTIMYKKKKKKNVVKFGSLCRVLINFVDEFGGLMSFFHTMVLLNDPTIIGFVVLVFLIRGGGGAKSISDFFLTNYM